MKICELKTKDERNDYLYNEVPEELRSLVKNHVEIWFERRRFTDQHDAVSIANRLKGQLLS